jgi:uncharacterized protein YggE
MKKILSALVLLLSFLGQAQDNLSTRPFIEISGTSETFVVPDEIYLQITLLERMEGKEKITIERQENDLKKNLKEIGIDLSNLSLSSANADYKSIRRKEKDVLISKHYQLKLATTDQLAKVYERLDKLNADDASVQRVANSKIADFQKENRIKALRAAKEKADYLLNAIGHQAGTALFIQESDNYVDEGPAQTRMWAMKANMITEDRQQEEPLAFTKIKVRSSYLVRYEILKK